MAEAAAQTKACPFCAEQIQVTAKKCKHCGEMLDGSAKTTVVVVQNGASPGVAAVLSACFPGLGQLYAGRFLAAIGFFLGAAIGAFPFIVPGAIVWFIGIFHAYYAASPSSDGAKERKSVNAAFLVCVVIVVAVFALAMGSLVRKQYLESKAAGEKRAEEIIKKQKAGK